MSFILDALKKSEHERQDRSGPDLAYAPGVHERESLPRWVYILGALLLINLLALGGVLLFDRPDPLPAVPAQATPSPGTPSGQDPAAAREAANGGDPAPRPEPREQPAPRAQPVVNLAGTQAPAKDVKAPEQTRPLQREAGAPGKDLQAGASGAEPGQSGTAAPTPVPPAVSYSQSSLGDPIPPTLSELQGQGKLMGLQSLSLDLHVYTEAKDGRFVFVNLNKYREGEQLREGPLVEQITPDGVILLHKGERFLVPRS